MCGGAGMGYLFCFLRGEELRNLNCAFSFETSSRSAAISFCTPADPGSSFDSLAGAGADGRGAERGIHEREKVGGRRCGRGQDGGQMMGLTEHLIDLLLRSAERLERLPEVNVHEILEQSVVHANCTGEQFIREHVQLDRFIFEENLRENLRG